MHTQISPHHDADEHAHGLFFMISLWLMVAGICAVVANILAAEVVRTVGS